MKRNEKRIRFFKSEKNPYASLLKKQITIRLGLETIDYFKSLAQKTGIPYQTLIDMYLSDCAAKKSKPF
jgi:predicted DNA binding CopG/RHH family protein